MACQGPTYEEAISMYIEEGYSREEAIEKLQNYPGSPHHKTLNCGGEVSRVDYKNFSQTPSPPTAVSLDEVTRMLCTLCGQLENAKQELFISYVPGLRKWWEEHQKIDQARIRREAKKNV